MPKRFLEGYISATIKLNRSVEIICAALVALMVLVIWFGVVTRYFLDLGITWTEEFSRFTMIWAALLAISCGAFYREHIGFEFIFSRLPGRIQIPLRIFLDCIGICFFAFLGFYGLTMTAQGASQYAMIFGMTMMVPFASVPVASALTIIQILGALARDLLGTDTRLPGVEMDEAT